MSSQPEKPDHFSITKLFATFSSENDCIDHLKLILWKHGEHCPYCSNTHIYHFKTSRKHKCASCRRVFSIRVGTIFQDSNVKLKVWFTAIYLISISKRGISSHQLARELGITQKTAWFMLQRIRFAMKKGNIRRPFLSGPAEADEVEIGGKEGHRIRHIEKYLGRRGRKLKVPAGKQRKNLFNNKQTVVGIIQPKGSVYTSIIPKQTTNIPKTFIYENLVKGSVLYTDTAYAFTGLEKDFIHDTVCHKNKEYKKKGTEVTTNHIENYWKNLQQGLVGIYNWVSHEHLQYYLEEFSFRFSNRESSLRNVFDLLIDGCDAGHLPYKQLKKEAKKSQQAILHQFVEHMSVPI